MGARYAWAVIVHLNGQLVPRDQAKISPLDRGFVFGDGVYEGLRTIDWRGNGHAGAREMARSGARVIGLQLHVERLYAGLEAARIETPRHEFAGLEAPTSLGRMTDELLAANGLRDAFVYWQVTRGTPSGDEPARLRVPPRGGLRGGVTVFGYASPQPSLEAIRGAGPLVKTCAVLNDPRWSMGFLKSTSLMGNVVCAMEADRRGCDDAILVRDGVVCEGLATNVILVTRSGEVVTPSLESAPMLAGVTRALLLEELRGELVSRRVTEEELRSAREVMLTGSSTMVACVSHLDGAPVGEGGWAGKPGPVCRRLQDVLLNAIGAGLDASLHNRHMLGRAWRGFDRAGGAGGAGSAGGANVCGAAPTVAPTVAATGASDRAVPGRA